MMSGSGRPHRLRQLTRHPSYLRFDLFPEPFIASALSQPPFSAAFELIQIRTGPNVGRPVYRGGFVEGTDAAIREEMRDVFARARGPEGEEKRRNMAALRELVNKSSFGENGSARDAMARLGTVE